MLENAKSTTPSSVYKRVRQEEKGARFGVHTSELDETGLATKREVRNERVLLSHSSERSCSADQFRRFFEPAFADDPEKRSTERYSLVYTAICSLRKNWDIRWFQFDLLGSTDEPESSAIDLLKTRSAAVWTRCRLPRSRTEAWIQLPIEIIERLEREGVHAEERVTAVLFAEVTPFSEEFRPRLLAALLRFIEDNRFTTDEEMITAVGSAIRKFAMNMPTTMFETYSQFFSRTATEKPSNEIELELAKAVVWRLVRVTHPKTGDFPNLEARLSELASDYLTARVILDKNFASIAMHSVIAVCLLDGLQQDQWIEKVIKLGMPWFTNLLARRLLDVANKRRALNGEDAKLRQRHERLIAIAP